jgi:DNA-binding transcriptional LysR family regulator
MKWPDRIGRRLKLRDLHIFLAVAQHKSMVKAANEIAVSQPVVSKAIADIEHTLQVRILDRAARRVEPTLYGRALLKWATLAFDDLQQSVREIEFLSDPTRGELRIGSTEPMAGGVLPTIVDRIWRKHPRISFHVMPMPATPTQYQALRDRAVELIIGRVPSRTPARDIASDVLFNERLFVVAGSRSPLLHRRKLTLADLAAYPWCIPPLDTIQGALAEEAFRANGLELPQARVTTVSLQMYSHLLATGRYLAVWPGSVLQFGAKHLHVRALPIELSAQPWPVAVATLKERTISPVAQLVIDCAHGLAVEARKGEWCAP